MDSNVTCLVIPKAKSRIVDYFQLNNDINRVPHLILNGAILIECKALYHVVLLSAKAETTRIFHNA